MTVGTAEACFSADRVESVRGESLKLHCPQWLSKNILEAPCAPCYLQSQQSGLAFRQLSQGRAAASEKEQCFRYSPVLPWARLIQKRNTCVATFFLCPTSNAKSPLGNTHNESVLRRPKVFTGELRRSRVPPGPMIEHKHQT